MGSVEVISISSCHRVGRAGEVGNESLKERSGLFEGLTPCPYGVNADVASKI